MNTLINKISKRAQQVIIMACCGLAFVSVSQSAPVAANVVVGETQRLKVVDSKLRPIFVPADITCCSQFENTDLYAYARGQGMLPFLIKYWGMYLGVG